MTPGQNLSPQSWPEWILDDARSQSDLPIQQHQVLYSCLRSTAQAPQVLEDYAHYVYYKHCREQLPARLPPAYLPSIEKLAISPMVHSALLALSASNLAHKNGSFKDRSHLYVYRSSAQSSQHLTVAFEFYQNALALLHTTAGPKPREPESCLLSAMLAVLFEWESGSPRAVHAHMNGAEAIVLANYRAIALTNSGRSLLGAWAEFHALWESHLLPFRRAEIDKLLSVPRILAHNFADCRVAIYMICSDACFLFKRLALVYCFGGEDASMSEAVQKARQWYNNRYEDLLPTVDGSELKGDEGSHSLESFVALIPHFRFLLRSWYDSLDAEDLPQEQRHGRAAVEQPSTSQHHTGLDESSAAIAYDVIEPLYFRSCTVARSYFYYCAAQILLTDDFIPQFSAAKTKSATDNHKNTNSTAPHARTDETFFNSSRERAAVPSLSWADTILRILAGLDWTDDAALSAYHEDLFWILWSVCSACLEPKLIAKVLNQLFPILQREYPKSTLVHLIEYWRTYFSFLLGKLALGWQPYLITLPTPANREMGNDEQIVVAVHGLHANGQMVHFTERICKK
jgi:hypothetical protein